ncbi:MAG: spermidine/putrescine ABC transporter substrate-binding protein [Chloroflexi bacterium]|nr:spermidine/putrescine ABC transporter substrate-binding protein [Chloroflexota bacterium]
MKRYITLSGVGAILVLVLFAVYRGVDSTKTPIVTPAAPPLAAELVLYDWKENMPQAVLDAFTQEYGVKVNYLTYEAQPEAIDNMRAGQTYDVVVIDSRFIPMLAKAGLLAALHKNNIPNLRNISANFRELAYDPDNRYSVPYNWGTTGLVVRSDLVAEPVTRWADLWDSRYAGRTGIWAGQDREMIGLTLKSLGYSANSMKPGELERALQRLLELKRDVVFLGDYDPASSADVLASGGVVIAMGYASDLLLGREKNPAITYVLPQEGALMWNDTFVILANSRNQYTAELFLNFLMRPDINAQIANENHYATPNEAALPFIDPAILNNPVIFPPNDSLVKAELILPLDEAGQKLYADIWRRFTGSSTP